MESIKTLQRLGNIHKARTPQEALKEMTRLAQEKHMLTEEMERWRSRIRRIETRLDEISTMEDWLGRFMDKPVVQRRKERGAPSVCNEDSNAGSAVRQEMTILY